MPQKPVCVECQVTMPVVRMGVAVVELFGDPPRIYRVWMADEHGCPSCGQRVLGGFGERAIHRHYDGPDLASWVQDTLLDPSNVRLWKERVNQEPDLKGILAEWLERYAKREED